MLEAVYVPQGSVLGPILFSIVIDSLSCVHANSFCMKYADDITFLHFVRDLREEKLQVEWDNVCHWSEVNSQPINFSKSCIMDIVTKQGLSLSEIRDSVGNALRNVTEVSILGVIVCDDLKWNTHFNSIVKKASRRICSMYNLIRSGCPPKLLFRAYVAYIRSLLLY